MTQQSKAWYKSKTVWTCATAIVGALAAYFTDQMGLKETVMSVLAALAVIFLRKGQGVAIGKNLLLAGLLISVSGCAGLVSTIQHNEMWKADKYGEAPRFKLNLGPSEDVLKKLDSEDMKQVLLAYADAMKDLASLHLSFTQTIGSKSAAEGRQEAQADVDIPLTGGP